MCWSPERGSNPRPLITSQALCQLSYLGGLFPHTKKLCVTRACQADHFPANLHKALQHHVGEKPLHALAGENPASDRLERHRTNFLEVRLILAGLLVILDDVAQDLALEVLAGGERHSMYLPQVLSKSKGNKHDISVRYPPPVTTCARLVTGKYVRQDCLVSGLVLEP